MTAADLLGELARPSGFVAGCGAAVVAGTVVSVVPRLTRARLPSVPPVVVSILVVMVQVSGTFGSRQEEAQRLGRILRPKGGDDVAHFYTLVTRDTREMDFAHHRQLFLTEQGYSYEIHDQSDVMDTPAKSVVAKSR